MQCRESEHVSGPLTTQTTIDEIVENFSMLEDWQDRYAYLIELGRQLTPVPKEDLTDANKVRGCVSQVWLTVDEKDGDLHFRGASDAHIVSGLVAVTLTLFSGNTPARILATDEQAIFEEIGLSEHLTPQRSNGLRSMVSRIKAIAENCAS